jgi:hypothetical protein
VKKKKNHAIFRDSKTGRFTTRRKWERKNLPKRSLRKRSKPLYREGEAFETRRFKYKYRQWTLRDFAASTIGAVIKKVERERRPHPIAFYVHIEYEDNDEMSGDVGTNFFKFRQENAAPCEDVCWGLVNAYDINRIERVEMLATYAVKFHQNKKLKKKGKKHVKNSKRKVTKKRTKTYHAKNTKKRHRK